MKHRVSKDWDKFQKDSLQMTIENTHKVILKILKIKE